MASITKYNSDQFLVSEFDISCIQWAIDHCPKPAMPDSTAMTLGTAQIALDTISAYLHRLGLVRRSDRRI
jgi:hypothetical protein